MLKIPGLHLDGDFFQKPITMKIEVKDTLTIGALSKQFSNRFPFLRLEFFRGAAGTLPKAEMRVNDKDIALSALRRSHTEGEFTIKGSDTAGTLETIFLERFGLNVQVFRRSGDNWILTTATDNFTLDRLNAIGEEMAVPVEPPEPEDIHEHE